MWKPDESLEDYTVRPVPQVASKPPRSVSLQRTGEVEVLKPLIIPEVRTSWLGINRQLWFRRFLVAGSSALVMIALVLVTAILVGISDQTSGPDIATNEESDYTLPQPEELFSFDLSIPLTFVGSTGEIVRSNTRRRSVRPTMHLAVNKPRRQFRPPLEPEDPNFVPTTLVIYAQNGVITSHIEPWLQSSDR